MKNEFTHRTLHLPMLRQKLRGFLDGMTSVVGLPNLPNTHISSLGVRHEGPVGFEGVR